MREEPSLLGCLNSHPFGDDREREGDGLRDKRDAHCREEGEGETLVEKPEGFPEREAPKTQPSLEDEPARLNREAGIEPEEAVVLNNLSHDREGGLVETRPMDVRRHVCFHNIEGVKVDEVHSGGEHP